MRIAVGGVSHETNTFCSRATVVSDFKLHEWSLGEDIVRKHLGVRDYVGGILDAAQRADIEVIPTFLAHATTSGTIAKDAFNELRQHLLAVIRAAGPVDALCLTLHGAGVAEDVDDLEGALLEDIREQSGHSVPIVVTLDLHGNITHTMIDHTDVLLGVNHYPHVDMFERGQEAVVMASRIISGEIEPVMHLVKLPMLIPSMASNLSPIKETNELCWEWERHPGVLDCTMFHGCHPSDIPSVGVSVLALTDGDQELARRAAEDVARYIWRRRNDFRLIPVSPTDAFQKASAIEGRPIVINDNSDNPGGGGPGDGTHLLRAMLNAELEEACFGFIFDPETAQQAHTHGAGAVIDIKLGGKTEPIHGSPIQTRAYVKCLTDGRFIQQSPMGRGAHVNLGMMARLVIGGTDVLVSSIRAQTLDAEVFLLHGIDVTRYKIVALKSSAHFRAGLEPIARAIIRADTPGLVSADLSTFPYRRVSRPIWPLNPDAVWSSAEP